MKSHVRAMDISSSHVLLPEDLQTEVLTRLPVKSLVRFRGMSKRWMSLITNPRFISTHLTRIRKNSGGGGGGGWVLRLDKDEWGHIGDEGEPDFPYDLLKLYLGEWMPYKYNHLPYSSDHTRYSIVGYCDGIFCLSWKHLHRDKTHDGHYDCWPSIALCNPAIRELRVLPLSPTDYPPYKRREVVNIGFGYDPKTKDYLVVKTVITKSWDNGGRRQGLNCVDVYSMKDSCWRTVSLRGDTKKYAAVQKVTSFTNAPGVYTASGDLHWIMDDRWIVDERGIWVQRVMVSFHMDDDSLRVTNLPTVVNRGVSENHHALSVLDDKLSLIRYTYHPVCTRVEIFKMNNYELDDHDSWSLVTTLETLPMRAFPMGFWTKNLLLVYHRQKFKPILYDIVTKRSMDLTAEEESFYRESLVPVK